MVAARRYLRAIRAKKGRFGSILVSSDVAHRYRRLKALQCNTPGFPAHMVNTHQKAANTSSLLGAPLQSLGLPLANRLSLSILPRLCG